MTQTYRQEPSESEIGKPRSRPSTTARTFAALVVLSMVAMIVAVASSNRSALDTTANRTAANRPIPTSPTTTLPERVTATATLSEPPASHTLSAPLSPPTSNANEVCRQTWTYDSEGNALTYTDRRGITSINTYDRENRLASESRAGLMLQTLERDADGNVRRKTDALGRITTLAYDKASRKLSEDRSGLAIERWTYTPLGDAVTYTDADGRTTTNTYTSRRFLESESLAGETTRYTYDGAGHRLSREQPNGPDSTWTYAYDAAGNLVSVTDPMSQTTAFGHDANNNRTRITDANDHVTTFAYDERNRLNSKTYPGGDGWRWTYDGDNNRIRSIAPYGRVSETAYDALNRPTRTTYLGAPTGEVQSTAYTYDGNSNVRTVIETSSAGTRTETRDYDDFDRLTSVVDGDGRVLRYAYDDAGNRTRLTDSDGHDTVWTYNDLNQNTRVTVPGMGSTSLGYAPSGRVTEISRPDGSLTEQAFLDNGRLQSIRHGKAGQTLARYDYVYDPNGNRTEQRELNGVTTGDTTQRTRYVYDEADRLVEVQEPNRTTSYTLDAVGNRIAERVVDGNGTVISDSALVYNDRDQLTSRSDPVARVQVEQTWDANGNLATQTVNGQPPRVHTYDARDRLVGLTLPNSPNGPTTLRFAYHPDGLRREKTDGLTTTRYQYDGHSLLAETNAIGNTLRQFHYSATQLIGQTQAGTTPVYRHVLLDALRSPIALLDPTGLVTARTSYDAFGEIRAQLGTNGMLTTPNRNSANAELISSDGQPVGFTGYIKDSESGLYYASARYYDPTTARFTTEDPETGKDLEPPSLHRYLYAYANPTAYLDRNGRQAEILGMLSVRAQIELDPKVREQQRINTLGDAAAAWEFARDTVTSTFTLATTMLRAQAETDLREESRPASDALRAGLDNSWEAITDRPAERYFNYRDSIERKAQAYELANDPVNARKERAKLNIETVSAFLGAYGVTRSIARNGARVIAGANARSGIAGSATGIEAADGTVALVDSSPVSDGYLFRGTSEGYPGNPGLQRIGVTPASTDPVVSTLFATESENFGRGVLHIASPDDLKGIDIDAGNVLAGKEAEVAVGLPPLEFAKRASTTISAAGARSILRELDIKLPERIVDKDALGREITLSPRLNPAQTAEFLKRSKDLEE